MSHSELERLAKGEGFFSADFNSKKNLKAIKKKEESDQIAKDENDFYILRKKYLRIYSHWFFDMKIYPFYHDIYESDDLLQHIKQNSFIIFDDDNNEYTINEEYYLRMEEFLTSKFITSEKHQLNMDFLVALHLEREPDKYPSSPEDRIYLDQINYAISDLLHAETYRFVILVLENEKLTLEQLKSFIIDLEKYKEKIAFNKEYSKSYSPFLDSVFDAFKGVLNPKTSRAVTLNDMINEEIVDLYDLQEIVLKNSELLKYINYPTASDDGFLSKFGITKDDFRKEQKSKEFKKFLKDIKENLEQNIFHCKFIKSDILLYDLHSGKEQYETIDIEDLKKDSSLYLKDMFLYYFFVGLRDALIYITHVNVFLKKYNNNRNRILKKMEKITCKEKIQYSPILDIIGNMTYNTSKKHIYLIVIIAERLCLNKKEAWQLSKALGLNNYDSFKKHYDTVSKNYFYHYRILK